MLLAASHGAFWLRPPAISRRDMMNAGGSAVERLICGITAAGAAIGACVKPLSHHERSDHLWLKGALSALTHLPGG